MGEHRRVLHDRGVDWAAARNRAACGALGGLILAVLAMLVGLARAIIVAFTGRHIGSDGLVRGLSYYALGLAAAGALVGLLWPLRRGLIGRFVLGICAAAVTMAFIIASDHGPIASWRGEQIQALALFALIFGLPIGYQIGKQR